MNKDSAVPAIPVAQVAPVSPLVIERRPYPVFISTQSPATIVVPPTIVPSTTSIPATSIPATVPSAVVPPAAVIFGETTHDKRPVEHTITTTHDTRQVEHIERTEEPESRRRSFRGSARYATTTETR